MDPGLQMAACFAIKPNQLGFCGRQGDRDKKLLLDYLRGKDVSEEAVRDVLESFEALVPYLKLIARKNKIKDHLSYPVVEAYWIGNELLNRVTDGDVRKMIKEDFVSPSLLSGKAAAKIAALLPDGTLPHHTFHVLLVGSVTGKLDFNELNISNRCRICWGEVKEVGKNTISLFYQPLVKALGKKISLAGHLELRKVHRQPDVLNGLKEGDVLSFHWDNVCMILTPRQVQNLSFFTSLAVEKVNL